ncbi:8-oxo-dGTP diphosphatase [Kribbella orskensis]|uniref:8-oxo-dGTP diphosphatase n=1 Tax=Kribbella orskensis TaxID=2512216 RepID=A0ABY2BQJ1_9ACTN|nr:MULTISPECIES: NUDIX domain-containing protein [Kribbella]TCN37342.1 8-oxo-dGTP diphosphatase [Kribbella sp. VKM Ac-2500]TCO27750.1 8-oxo-dGTP diphosphatase [Kribbella orskensis]
MQTWVERFPELFAPAFWAWGELDVRFTTEQPADELVSNVHVVGRTEGGVVVCANDLGWRFLPGGTREPDEPIHETARRELLEEAGARITGPLTWIGAHRADHRRPGPYRPHLPHPVSYWINVVADVVIEAAPTNPPDGEQVTEVLVLPPDEAIAYLDEHPDGVMGNVVRLAQAMGLV